MYSVFFGKTGVTYVSLSTTTIAYRIAPTPSHHPTTYLQALRTVQGDDQLGQWRNQKFLVGGAAKTNIIDILSLQVERKIYVGNN
jgi:hypothetical protein